MRLRALREFIVLIACGVTVLALTPSASAEEGWATWYGPGFDGKPMSNGQIFNMYDPTTVASNTLAFGTWLKVTNQNNGKSVWVQVRDRGPFGNDGVKLDLSYAASAAIAQTVPATMWVRYEIVSGPGAEPVAPTSTRIPATWTLGPMPTRTPTRTPTPAPFLPTSTPTYTRVPPTATSYPPTFTPFPPTSTSVFRTSTPLPTSTPAPSGVALTPTATPSWTAMFPTQLATETTSAVSTATPTASSALSSASGLIPAPDRYVVRPGETLWSIVRRFGLDIDGVQEANGLTSPDKLRAGQTLVLGVSLASPVPTPRAVAALAPLPTPTVAAPNRERLAEPTISPPTEPAASFVGADRYRVRAADEANVFWDIALATGIPFEALARANDLGKSASVIGDSPERPAELTPEASIAADEAPVAVADVPDGQSGSPDPEPEAASPGHIVQGGETPSEAAPPADVGDAEAVGEGSCTLLEWVLFQLALTGRQCGR